MKTRKKIGYKGVQQELFTKVQGRQVQLHTSHLHSSNSLYVNKVPLDVLLFSEPLYRTPFCFPPECCVVASVRERKRHARPHAHRGTPATLYISVKSSKSLSRSGACVRTRLGMSISCIVKAARERALFAQRDEILDTTVQISTRPVVGLLLKKFLKGKRSLPHTHTHTLRSTTMGFANSLSFPGGGPMGFSPLAVQLTI